MSAVDDFNWPANPVESEMKLSITRLVLLTAVDRGLVANDTQHVPHIHLGPDGWVPVPSSIRGLREAGLVDVMYGASDAERWRHWRLTEQGAIALRLDAEMCAA